jgi:hypothetical protein
MAAAAAAAALRLPGRGERDDGTGAAAASSAAGPASAARVSESTDWPSEADSSPLRLLFWFGALATAAVAPASMLMRVFAPPAAASEESVFTSATE